MKLNGGRHVIGILRGFDPFMNMVVDETIEECKDGSKNNIGMVVSRLNLFFSLSGLEKFYFCIYNVLFEYRLKNVFEIIY